MDLENNKEEIQETKKSLEPDSLPTNFLGLTGLGAQKVLTPEKISCQNHINEILAFSREKFATDVHISSGQPIFFRVFTRLVPQTQDCLLPESVEKMAQDLLSPEQKKDLDEQGDLECIYILEGFGRFRVTMMKKRNGLDIAIRLIPLCLPTYAQLGLPAPCLELLNWKQGMILITGPAGCGKTTTLSALVEKINQEKEEHIITIENPIEIVFHSQKAQISQRQIGLHTLSQDAAIRAALREDPDVLVISELRDLSTIQLAATAAETGHLVLGTMNTNDAMQTILRIINVFSPDEQDIVRNMISESLKGVICQQFIPKKDGTGVVVAYEILVVNSAVTNLIRKGNLEQLMNVIATGGAEGMVTFDSSLRNLYESGTISGAEVYERCFNKKEFESIKDN